jgi:ATP-dependent Clp protease ATP-binding subunit ClpC
MVDAAVMESNVLRHNYIGTEHMVLAAIQETHSVAWNFFGEMGLAINDVRFAAADIAAKNPSSALEPVEAAQGQKQQQSQGNGKQKQSILAAFSRDLTALAREGKVDPVIGREREIKRVIQILSRRNKNNPVLIGDPGVGKTAIAEGLAIKIASGAVPQNLGNKRLLTLDLAQMIAGTKYRGEFEERIKRVLKEITEQKNVILFIDELHTLVGAGSGEGTMDASNMLKPALARGELQCIGATTLAEYRKYFEKDAALERRFQIIQVNEPSDEETKKILEGIKNKYEEFHGVVYEPEVIDAVVRYSRRYISERFFPDKAIDLLDEAGAMKRIEENDRPPEIEELEKAIAALDEEKQVFVQTQNYEKAAEARDKMDILKQKLNSFRAYWQSTQGKQRKPVAAQDICAVIESMTGIPAENLSTTDTKRLLDMETEIHKSVIGQHDAVSTISSAIRRSRAGVSSVKRPSGSFIFLGPTGVGKTQLAKSLAKFLFGSEDSLIRIDMSDFMEKHNVSRLTGAPPGYIGYGEGGFLTEKIRRNPYSVVLLDEIEKAHPDVFNLLLQILEEGELVDSMGHHVNFRNTVIIMTSNAGAREISSDSHLGFDTRAGGIMSYSEIKTSALTELKRLMSPELLNRIDDTIVFNALSPEEVAAILDIRLAELADRLSERKLRLKVLPAAKQYLAANGYDPTMGARPMRRIIQRDIEDPLANLILSGELTGQADPVGCEANDERMDAPGTVVIDCKDDVITVVIRKAKKPELVSVGIGELVDARESVFES